MNNGSVVSITNLGTAGAGLTIGGSAQSPLGSGTLTLNGGSRITINAAPGLANAVIGRDGTGVATLRGGSQIDIGDGTVAVGRSSTGIGTASVQSGSKMLARAINIGGFSDADRGSTGTVTVTGIGIGSELIGIGGFIGVGRGSGGDGTLTVSDGGKASAISMSVGRAGATGRLNVTNGSIDLIGQQTAAVGGVPANLTVGIGGGTGGAGTGFANLVGSTVTIANNALTNANGDGPATASLNLGGRSDIPGGTGTLTMTNSQITVGAANGQASVNIGRTGSGIATLTGGLISVSDGSSNNGSVFVAREAGSTGKLSLSGGSTVSAGFVGVGVSAAGVGKNLGPAGGTGTLDLGEVGGEGTVFAPRFELGAGSTLKGSGTIEAGPAGEVVIGGTIAPGKSPGCIRILCDVTMLFGSQLILEVDGNGADIEIDQLVFGDDSTFDLTQLQIIFAFVGDTSPEKANLDLNEFLRAETPDGETSLEELFGKNGNAADWGSAVSYDRFAFQSSVYDVTSFNFNPETGRITGVEASQIPEPATCALVLLALGLMARRQRRAAAMH